LPAGFTGGVRVPTVWPLGPAVNKLQVDDVLVSVDGIEIGQDATVPLRGNERIHFSHLVTRRVAEQEVVKLGVRRQGVEVEVEIQLKTDRWLVPRFDGYDAHPEYAIFGGLVFVPLSQPWAEVKGHDRCARVLVLQHWGVALPEEGRQIIVLSKVLAHQCNVGYHSCTCMVLHTFNGVVIENLAQLVRNVASCTTKTYTFEFLRTGSDGKELVVLDREECARAELEIMQQHLIAESALVRGSSHPGARLLERSKNGAKSCVDGTDCKATTDESSETSKLGSSKLKQTSAATADQAITF
jgi:hypothetical protein